MSKKNEMKRTKKSILCVLLILALVLFNLTIIEGLFYQSTDTNEESFMVPMRDGINLATDVYFPITYKEGSTFSTILIRTPYNKNHLSTYTPYLTGTSYIVVVQDTRGRFSSEGIDTIFMNASIDGYDTIEWIKNQPWSNGKIGTFGPSALGIVQLFLQLSQPEGLEAQFIQVATPDFYTTVYQGGAFRQSLIQGWLQSQGSTFWLPTIYQHETYSDFWKNVTLTGKYNKVVSPAVFQGGWYDCFSQGTLDSFMGYQYDSPTELTNKSHLIMGPWGHGTNYETQLGEINFPSNAIDVYTMALYEDFFGHYLNNEQLVNHPKVRYYCMGPEGSNKIGNFWRTSEIWPIPAENTSYYLHSDYTISTTVPSEPESYTSYIYDPKNPVNTRGGSNLNIPSGPYDQKNIESRSDVLIFTSSELEDYVEVTGRIKAKLWISSNCTDTDFTVKITDVYPDGRSMLIQDGIIRAKNRNHKSEPVLLTPDEIVPVEIDLWSTSYIFNPGHKIRIAISSSNYPRFSVNTNTGASIFSNNDTYIANNTIYHDSEHPSHIILPINTDGDIPGTEDTATTTNTTSSNPKTDTETIPSETNLGLIGIIAGIFVPPICMVIIRKKYW